MDENGSGDHDRLARVRLTILLLEREILTLLQDPLTSQSADGPQATRLHIANGKLEHAKRERDSLIQAIVTQGRT